MARKALLVGVNDYVSSNDLRGCVNDVTNMRHILRTYLGFGNREIRVLLDRRATKGAILHRLEWLVRDSKPGDFLVFHFSGHGSQIRDRDGDEELLDGMDELICPSDMNWNDGYITDDVLQKIFTKLPKGVLLEVFLDCCHSGTGLRETLDRPPEQGPEHPTQNRHLPPPWDITARWEGEEDELEQRTFRTARQTVHHILWAGCKANQTSADAYINGDYNGAFTYYLCKHIRDSNARISRRELLDRARASLSYHGYSQVPQLEIEATVRDREALQSID